MQIAHMSAFLDRVLEMTQVKCIQNIYSDGDEIDSYTQFSLHIVDSGLLVHSYI